jgi:hypothetical protein
LKRKKPDDVDWGVIGVIGVAVFGALGLAGYIGATREGRVHDDEAKQHATNEHTATSGKSVAVVIPSCNCISGSATPPTEVILLAPPMDRMQPWSVDIRRSFGPLNRFALPDAPGAVLVASSKTLAPDVGMACDPRVFVLIANDEATAWSSSDASWKWNAKLPAPLATSHVAAVPLEGSSITSTCTELGTEGDAVVVPLSSGKNVHLSLADGRAL